MENGDIDTDREIEKERTRIRKMRDKERAWERHFRMQRECQ
jgi:hypothetical protein